MYVISFRPETLEGLGHQLKQIKGCSIEGDVATFSDGAISHLDTQEGWLLLVTPAQSPVRVLRIPTTVINMVEEIKSPADSGSEGGGRGGGGSRSS